MAERSSGTRLSRWSERKLEVKAREQAEGPPDQVPAPVDGGGDADGDALPELPDIDTLDKDSDYSMFMDARVPEELQRLALRKLWSTDPVYANLDGLNDYDPGHMKFLEQISETAQRLINEALNKEDAEKAESDTLTEDETPDPGSDVEAEISAPDADGNRSDGIAEYADVEDMDDPDDIEPSKS
ncbi:MAG: DUF3306 domain-containing protein [Rhodospirillales bacterium]|nr:DUF3306 domain-containing protein [Rhodospirillales bacterium]